MQSPSLTSVFTLIIWLACAAVGIVGMFCPYARPRPPIQPPVPFHAELIKVDLTTEPLVPPIETQPPPQNPKEPPPLLEPSKPLQAPPLVAVAEPNPAIAFPLPVEGPVQIVPATQASYTKPFVQADTPPSIQPTEPTTLTFGLGEGKQPAPEYPRRALAAGQEGTVVVLFSVADNGRVLSAEADSSSPWALLNEAALRVIRERWRFQPGQPRLFKVAIRFELKK